MSERRPHSSSSRDAAAIEQAAGNWIARLDRGLAPEEAAQFAAWQAADPRHAAELARLSATWRALDTADEVPEIMQVAHAVEEKQNRRAAAHRWRSWALAGLGAAAAIALAWTIFLRTPGLADRKPAAAVASAGHRSYKIVPSAAQRLTLADGTVVELNTGSAVEPAFTADERRVRLVRGEAHFTVVKDAARPFIVQAGHVAVLAVGTAFNVRFAPAAVEVLVTEGQVAIATPEDGGQRTEVREQRSENGQEVPSSALRPLSSETLVTAGQRVVIPVAVSAPATPVAVTPADLERALAWQGTQLVFERTSLDEAAAAFNSFNRRQLVLGDPVLRTRKLGGTFRADNLDAFVRLLEAGFDITADRHGETEIVLHMVLAELKPN